MFHVELRQFPHVARAFNLSPEELNDRFLTPWTRGTQIELQDRKWSRARTRLTIYEGRALEVSEIGLGRGWANATRTGSEVTERLMIEAASTAAARPELAALKQALVERADQGRLSATDVLEVAARLGCAADEQTLLDAVWQLLEEGRLLLGPPAGTG